MIWSDKCKNVGQIRLSNVDKFFQVQIACITAYDCEADHSDWELLNSFLFKIY